MWHWSHRGVAVELQGCGRGATTYQINPDQHHTHNQITRGTLRFPSALRFPPSTKRLAFATSVGLSAADLRYINP